MEPLVKSDLDKELEKGRTRATVRGTAFQSYTEGAKYKVPEITEQVLDVMLFHEVANTLAMLQVIGSSIQ